MDYSKLKGNAMNKIGFSIDGEESDQEEPEAGYAESNPEDDADEDESAEFRYWLFRTGADFFMVYGFVMGVKNVISFFKED